MNRTGDYLKSIVMKSTPDCSQCENRNIDTRKVRKVEYEGKKWLDVTDFFCESFYNGDTMMHDIAPSMKMVRKNCRKQ